MKALVLTRKIKDELAEHFRKGGTVNNVPGELARVSMQDRLSCFEYHKKRLDKNRESIRNDGFGAMP